MTDVTGRNESHIQALINRARLGDQQACEGLFDHFVGASYRLSFGVLLNKQDAEEVVQDSFSYAFRRLDHYDEQRSAFKTWLYSITMSRCRNKRRRKWLPTVNLEEVTEWLPGKQPQPETQAARHDTHNQIRSALKQLTPKQREAVVLRYFEGLTYREMAQVLDCSQKTAESRVRLAHDSLYNLLAEHRDSLLDGLVGYEAR